MTTDLIILEDDFPVFNPEARLIKEYKAILARDKGSKGDYDGRNKSIATRELAFVCFFANLKSIYHIQFEDENRREKEIKTALELPLEWKRDDLINRAITEYSSTQITPSSNLLVSVRRALNTSKKIVDHLEQEVRENSSLLEGGNSSDAERKSLMTKIKADVKEIITISKDISEQLEAIDKLEDKYVKELEIIKGRKNAVINAWEV